MEEFTGNFRLWKIMDMQRYEAIGITPVLKIQMFSGISTSEYK